MEILSEHLCQGWLEGYLLTGRHGLFNCYEAFIHIVDSMFNQHAKWLKTTREIPGAGRSRRSTTCSPRTSGGRTTTASRTRIPGFIDHVVNKKAEVIRVYLPPDANTLLSVADHCLRSRNYVNVIVAGKQPALDYLSIDDAIIHCTRGLGDLGVGVVRRGRRARRRARLRRRRPDARDARRRRAAPRAPARAEGARRQRRRPDAAPVGERAPARSLRHRVRRALHDFPADRLRLPRLSVADPPPHLPAPQPRQPARARLQGGGHDDDAVRHGHAQRPRPLPPRDRRDRPRPRSRRARRAPAPGDGGAPARARAYTREHGDDDPEIRDWTWPY